MRNILRLNNQEAKNFFLKSESYVNIDLPPYFNFGKLLKEVSPLLNDRKLKNKIINTDFINRAELSSLKDVVEEKEFDIFKYV